MPYQIIFQLKVFLHCVCVYKVYTKSLSKISLIYLAALSKRTFFDCQNLPYQYSSY